MTRRVTDILCVFQIQLARLRREAGPFLLAAVVFPLVMYMFTSAVGAPGAGAAMDAAHRVRFLSGSIVFSLSLTAISWLGYLLLENRFTGRLKLFATLPLAPSSYVTGVFSGTYICSPFEPLVFAKLFSFIFPNKSRSHSPT